MKIMRGALVLPYFKESIGNTWGAFLAVWKSLKAQVSLSINILLFKKSLMKVASSNMMDVFR